MDYLKGGHQVGVYVEEASDLGRAVQEPGDVDWTIPESCDTGGLRQGLLTRKTLDNEGDIQQGFWDFRQSVGGVADRVANKGTTLTFCPNSTSWWNCDWRDTCKACMEGSYCHSCWKTFLLSVLWSCWMMTVVTHLFHKNILFLCPKPQRSIVGSKTVVYVLQAIWIQAVRL